MIGWETLALVGLNLVSAGSQMSQAKQQAKSAIREGEIASKNKAREIAYKAARVKSSFLNSGVTLEGTPEASIGGIFDVGLEDLNLMRDNYNTQSKNIVSAARTKALSGIASSFSLTSLDGFGGGFNQGFSNPVLSGRGFGYSGPGGVSGIKWNS